MAAGIARSAVAVRPLAAKQGPPGISSAPPTLADQHEPGTNDR
jgi:hypothetical protein